MRLAVRLFASLATLAFTAASAQAQTLHQFSMLALSPSGDLVAAVELAETATNAAATADPAKGALTAAAPATALSATAAPVTADPATGALAKRASATAGSSAASSATAASSAAASGTSASATAASGVASVSASAASGAASAPASAAASAPAPHGVIVLRSVKDGRVVRTIDPCAKCSYSGLAFGPNGRLAYLSRDREAGTVTLLLDGGGPAAPHTVATVKGIAQTPRFSPDGRRIALLVTIGAAKEAGAVEAGVRLVGEIGETDDKRRIAVFDAAASVSADAVKPVSPDDRYVYEYAWTPDGTGFVATTALGNGDNNWWIATLDAIDASSGVVRRIAKPSTQLNFPRVSPDGKTVAYIGGLMSDFGSVGGDVWTVPFAGGTPTNITPNTTVSHVSLDWLAGGLRSVALGGDTLRAVAFDAVGKTTTLWSRAAGLAAGDGRIAWSADGRAIATVAQDYEHPPEIFAGPLGRPAQITDENRALPSIASARSVTWKSGPYDVQGWLVAPKPAGPSYRATNESSNAAVSGTTNGAAKGADPAKKAPMITMVHGGPSAAATPGFLFQGAPADLVKAGYWLFYPNPRGSYGQGEAFTAANKRDFGGGDLRDILAGIDAVEKIAPIDDARLGLMGFSYGGFMAMWANTQTNRFKAIAAGAGLSNWISYYGINGIDQWMLPFFGATMYDDRKAYEDVSAINFIKAAKTPTFIYVGERDIEVPPPQSIEYWHALREMGVPTTLVIYPNEGHGIRSKEGAADVRKRLVGWFGKYLGR